MIRHLVALRFAPETTASEKQALFDALAALSAQLDGVLAFEARANVSPETQMVRGFHDLFWIDFEDAAARDGYLANPSHQAVGARLVAALEGGADGVFVADFEV